MKLKTTEHFRSVIIILFIVLGLISGLIGGLLGIGGGVVIVPALYFLFKGFGLYQSHLMQVAVCTALASSFVTSGSSTVWHMLKGAVSVSILKFLIPGILVGVIIGACIGHFISSEILSALFGGLAIFFGVYFCFPTLRFFIANNPNITLIFFFTGYRALIELVRNWWRNHYISNSSWISSEC